MSDITPVPVKAVRSASRPQRTTMTDHTNPRKLTTSGGMYVVSMPPGFWTKCNLKQGDRVVLEPGDESFTARKVTYEVSTDE